MGVLRKLDVGLATEGRPCIYPPTRDDPKPIEVMIARWGNEAFQRALFNGVGKRIQKAKQLDFDKNREAVRRAVSKHVIKGWKNMELGPDTGEVPYSPDKAFEVISDPRYDEFYDWIVEEAGEDAEYAERATGEVLGNSSDSSAGS